MSSVNVRRDHAPSHVNGAVVGALVGVIALVSIGLGLAGAAAYLGYLWLVNPW